MPKKILVIEGDSALAGSIASAIQARGAEVAVAGDAAGAIDAVRRERPDGIVLCAELPGGSGFVVCNKIRKEQDLREIPLVLTSAESSEETFEKHSKLRTRADVYLRKPFAVPALLGELVRLAGLPEGAPAADPAPPAGGGAADLGAGADDEELIATFEAAFDSIAQLPEVAEPIDHPIPQDEVEAAAAMLDGVVDAEPSPPPRAPAAAPPPAAAGATDAENQQLRAELLRVRGELQRVRAELEAANAARAELARKVAAEGAKAREAASAAEQLRADRERLLAERERVRAALQTALSQLANS